MSRHVGPTRLTVKALEARLRAIAKLDQAAVLLELPGHHLQRAAGENA